MIHLQGLSALLSLDHRGRRLWRTLHTVVTKDDLLFANFALFLFKSLNLPKICRAGRCKIVICNSTELDDAPIRQYAQRCCQMGLYQCCVSLICDGEEL